MTYLIIYNPVSGKEANRHEKFGASIMRLGTAGDDLIVYQMQGKGDGARYIHDLREEEYARIDRVIAGGGDGTLHEVVNAVLARGIDKQIGYIPLGSTNDYASNLDIHPESCVDVILNGTAKRLDVGCFNGEFFTYVAAFGSMVSVSYSTPQDIKNTLGHAAYILEGIKQLGDLAAPVKQVHVVTDETEFTEGVWLGIVSNSKSIGGMKCWGDLAALDDGEMEYLFIKQPKNLLDANSILFSMLQADYDNPFILTGTTKHLSVDFEEETAWTLDGEDGGTWSHVDIEIRPQAMELFVGKDMK